MKQMDIEMNKLQQLLEADATSRGSA